MTLTMGFYATTAPPPERAARKRAAGDLSGGLKTRVSRFFGTPKTRVAGLKLRTDGDGPRL
jgi:hypothetical protein